jgi:hypothetical protein
LYNQAEGFFKDDNNTPTHQHTITPINQQTRQDKSYQQVIDNEQKNILNTKSDHSSDIKVDLVEQDIRKLSYFDPSDTHDTNVKGKYANLVFHLDTVVMMNANCHEEG